MAAGPDVPVLASSAIREALVPMASFYVIFMAALGLGLRALRRRGTGPVAETGGPPGGQNTVPGAPRRWAALIGHVLRTAIGGYLLLIAVSFAYYYGVARVGGEFLYSVITGPALLIGLTMPVFAAASWASERKRGRRRKPPGEGPPPALSAACRGRDGSHGHRDRDLQSRAVALSTTGVGGGPAARGRMNTHAETGRPGDSGGVHCRAKRHP